MKLLGRPPTSLTQEAEVAGCASEVAGLLGGYASEVAGLAINLVRKLNE